MLLCPAKVPLLTIVVVGGELLNKETINNFLYDSSLGESRYHLLNIYGLMEATMAITTEECSITICGFIIGDCLDCAGIIIMDLNIDYLVKVPLPMTGELAITGP